MTTFSRNERQLSIGITDNFRQEYAMRHITKLIKEVMTSKRQKNKLKPIKLAQNKRKLKICGVYNSKNEVLPSIKIQI